jgi:hypothetical protein
MGKGVKNTRDAIFIALIVLLLLIGVYLAVAGRDLSPGRLNTSPGGP